MTNQHPITPPAKKIEEWVAMLEYHRDEQVFSLAAQWGADQELDECCMWITQEKSVLIAEELGIARRPKLPNLKEQALNLLNNHNNGWTPSPKQWQTIRIAIEALPND
jgi:hypothetical protein